MINLITKIYLSVLAVVGISSSFTLLLLNGTSVDGVNPRVITLTIQESIAYSVARQCLVITLILGFVYFILHIVDKHNHN